MKYLLVVHPVCSCIDWGNGLKKNFMTNGCEGALPQIHRAGRDLWKSSSSLPFPRQISTAVIPDRSLHKLLLSLPMIKTLNLPCTVPSSPFVFTVGNTFLTSNPHSPHSGFIPLLLVPSAKDNGG